MHCSRSAPVIPTHWLGVAPAAEAPPEALLPEALSLGELVLGEVALGEELLPAEPPVAPLDPVVVSELPPLLELPLLIPAPPPDDPALPALPPLDCAQEAVAKPTIAAVTAALITFTIMMEFLQG